MACARIRRLTLTNFRSYHSAQIEVGTGVCKNIQEARADITRLRAIISSLAARSLWAMTSAVMASTFRTGKSDEAVADVMDALGCPTRPRPA